MEVTHDVVVLGTGAAGLTAALAAAGQGASVGLYEKFDALGGTTAVSGGVVWLPVHPHEDEAGAPLTREDALAYLAALSHGLMHDDLVEAFVDTGPELVEWVEANTDIRLRVISGFPDYHPEHPGGKPHGGRSLMPELFPYKTLGEWADRVIRFPDIPAMPGFNQRDTGNPLGINITPDMVEQIVEEDMRFGGAALVGGLLKACLERGILPVTSARATDLIVRDGKVTGVVIEREECRKPVTARSGVIIATGGFEWDDGLVKEFLRGPMEGAASPPSNTGDGLRMAMKVGAALGNLREAWWIPVVKIPGHEAWGHQRNTIILGERTRPRCIMVNKRGHRFVNEAANYNAMGACFHEFDVTGFEYTNIPAWMVFDQEHLRRYGFLRVPPGGEAPEWFNGSSTLGELATRIGACPEELQATVARWNAQVAEERDPDFGRGDSAYDSWWGDWSRAGTAATLGPLDTSPYYAVQIHSGTLGTKGGPQTDVNGQVLHVDGQPIPGLYAAGNAMAGTTGMVYGGAGGTIGPAMVWGFRAGRHAARKRVAIGAFAESD